MQDRSHRTFAGLLRSAVEEPGTLSSAYRQFHTYSLGNQLLAMFQCQARGLKPGPMATFPRWKELGRHVRKGQKALTLCMPLTLKRRAEPDADAADSVTIVMLLSLCGSSTGRGGSSWLRPKEPSCRSRLRPSRHRL